MASPLIIQLRSRSMLEEKDQGHGREKIDRKNKTKARNPHIYICVISIYSHAKMNDELLVNIVYQLIHYI